MLKIKNPSLVIGAIFVLLIATTGLTEGVSSVEGITTVQEDAQVMKTLSSLAIADNFGFIGLDEGGEDAREDNQRTLVSDNLGLEAGNFDKYLTNLFNLALIIGSVLAVLMIATAGLQYMTTDAVLGKSDSKERIRGAVVGLLMILSIGIFFQTVNPNILSFDLTSGTRKSQGQPRSNNLPGVSTSPNPIHPGSTIGSSYINPTWTAVPKQIQDFGAVLSCKDVKGDGWVKIDANNCAGTAPAGRGTCCGQNPNFRPPTTPIAQSGNLTRVGIGGWCYKAEDFGEIRCFTDELLCINHDAENGESTTSCKERELSSEEVAEIELAKKLIEEIGNVNVFNTPSLITPTQ